MSKYSNSAAACVPTAAACGASAAATLPTGPEPGGLLAWMRRAGAAGLLALAALQPAQALPPQKTITVPTGIYVRPGGTSYSWVASTDSSGNAVQDLGYQNITAFSWFLTRGRIESSTDGGANWTTYPITTDGIPFPAGYLAVSGRLWRFVDTSPADTTTVNNVSNCWHLVSTPGSTTCSGATVIPDNAPTDIASSKNTIFDNTATGATVAVLTPTDTGDSLRGYWTLESQSVANLFAISFNRNTGNTALLTRGTGAVPALGAIPTVTVRYHDVYQTDASGNPIAGQGFSKTLSFTVVAEVSNDLTLGNDVAVNTYTTSNQISPAVARLSSDNLAVVWQSQGQGGKVPASNSGIYGQLLTPTGSKSGAEFVVSNSSAATDEQQPAVAALNAGRFVVAYTTNSAGTYDIGYRIVEANGTVGAQQIAHAASAAVESYPAVATLTDGSFVIAWASSTGDIRARQFAAAGGAPVAGEVVFANGASAGGFYPSVASISSGGYVVVWADYVANHVFARVNGGSAIDTGMATAGYAPPRVAGLAGGGFVVVSESVVSAQTRIEAARYNNSGAPQGSRFQVHTGSAGERYAATIAALTGGGFVVGWTAEQGDFDYNGVFGRRYTAAGVAVDTNEFQINQHRLGDQSYPVLAPLPNDAFGAVWTDTSGASILAGDYFGDIEARVLLTASADLSITKTDGVTTAVPGGSVTYTITASNAGPTAVTGATVSDTFPAALTCTWTCVGAGGGSCTAAGSGNINTSNNNLPAGASVTYTASCAISAAASGTLSNTATVSSATTDPVPANNSASDSDTLTPQANLGITKTDGVTTVNAGGSTTYTITASNAGPSNTTATVADTFPGVLTCTWTCVGAGGGTCTAAGSGNISNGVSLPAGGSVTYTASCAISPAASGTLSNTATVTGVATDPSPGNNSATDSDTINALPSLTINDVSLAEGNSGTGSAIFTVGLSAPAGAGGVGFDIATANGTALAPGDYTSSSLTGQTIPAGSSSYSFTVLINGDSLNEANESFFVNVSNVTGAIATDAQGQGTINNDDPLPSLAIDNVSVVEGNAGSTPATFTVTLSPASGQSVSVNYASANGSAGSGDYTAVSGTLSFTPGQTTRTIMVPVTGDNLVEVNETFNVNLSSPTNANLGTVTGTGTINNDDSAGITLIQSGGTTSAAEGGAPDSYTLVLTSQPSANVTIAPDGLPQIAPMAAITFTPGNWNVPQVVTVVAEDDRTVEGAHSGSIGHLVSSVDSDYNAFALGLVDVAIGDNDSATYQFTAATSSTAEGAGAVSIQVSTVFNTSGSGVPALESAISVPYTLGVGTATAGGVDHSLVAGSVSIPANGATQQAGGPINNDNIVEGDETIVLNLGTETGGSAAQQAVVTLGATASHTATISDNDSATVNFAAATFSQSEAISPMAFTVTLSNPVQSGVTLAVNSANGTAGAADFTPVVAGSVSFPANSNAAQTVNVVVNNDALDEDDESYTLTLSGLTATGNVTLGTASASGSILDDDALPVLSLSSPSQNEGNAGSAPLTFVVTLTPVSGRDVSFTRATADGTATVANNDYVALGAALATIPAGTTSLTIPVSINGDTAYEGNESFSLNLTGISHATPATLSGTGTILEDDAQPTTTTIGAHTPSPSVVGQPYTVSVNVAAQTSSPTGTVTISDGSASCGPVTLVAGTAPNSSASCALASTSAGTRTLTASYTPASSAFITSSGSTSHSVNPASTTISVSGPSRSRINQSVSFTAALSVNAPGAGTPGGTLTLSSGASSCTATLPATSCSLNFPTLGSRTVTASYSGDSNFSGSSASGPGNAQTLVFALTDLAVTKSDGVGYYRPGDLLVYTVQLRNLGPDAAANFVVRDTIPAGLVNVVWSCDASGGAICPQSGGSGSLDQTIASMVAGGLLNFTFYGNVGGSPAQLVNTAQVVLPGDTTLDDPAPGNNSASDTNLLDFSFRDGFEDPAVSASTGSYRLPASAQPGAVDEVARAIHALRDSAGEALRVYARVFAGQPQYALATRDASGALRLAEWRTLSGEPVLAWTARSTASGWVLEVADLR